MAQSGVVKQINELAKDVERADDYLLKTMRKIGYTALSDVVNSGTVEQLIDVKGDVQNVASQLRYLERICGGLVKAYEKKVSEMNRAINKAAR